MELFECIKTRRSVRDFFDKPVEKEDLGRILEAGKQAPSAGNQQTWRFIIVTDRGLKLQIANACIQQMWVSHAPVIIAVCAEVEKLKRFYEERGEKLYSIQSCAAAIQNMLLAAHSLGLGACWVSAFDEIRLSQLLGIPGGVTVQAIIPVGYAARVPKEPMEYKLETIIFLEKWGSRITNVPVVLGRFAPTTQKVAKAGRNVFNTLKERISRIRKVP